MNISKNSYLIPDTQQRTDRDLGQMLSSIMARLNNLSGHWTAKRTRAQEMRELHRFSDRELWDVGLNRSDIVGIEQGTFRRD